jgi:hypothetical protein
MDPDVIGHYTVIGVSLWLAAVLLIGWLCERYKVSVRSSLRVWAIVNIAFGVWLLDRANYQLSALVALPVLMLIAWAAGYFVIDHWPRTG